MFVRPGNRSGHRWNGSDVAATRMKARAYRGANYTVSAGAGFKTIALDTVSYDTHGIFNAANGRFTPWLPGYYIANFMATIAAGTLFRAAVGKNGTQYRYAGLDRNSGGITGMPGSVVVPCDGVTDYLHLEIYYSAGATVQSGETWMEVLGPF